MAIDVIRSKGHEITDKEAEAAQIAILLHDIGRGPFSHALETCIIPDLHHEQLSLWFMEELNVEFKGKLSLAIKIFRNEHHKKFLHQLISGQLDMDRLDYLRRDSFFTGVTEGAVGSERIIKMLQVVDDKLVVEAKGIYSVEKFLIARRLMYWQVYLHKTVVVAELLLVHVLEKIKELHRSGLLKTGNKYFDYLITEKNNNEKSEIIRNFAMIDDFDIISLIKQNLDSDDRVLAMLADAVINRKFPRIILSKELFSNDFIGEVKEKFMTEYKFNAEETEYFVYSGEISNNAYSSLDERINIIFGQKLIEVTEASDILNFSVLGKVVKKYYVCAEKRY